MGEPKVHGITRAAPPEGRLPKATGGATPRVTRALTVYRRLWSDDRPPMADDRRTIAHGILNALIMSMTREELAEYYAGVRRVG